MEWQRRTTGENYTYNNKWAHEPAVMLRFPAVISVLYMREWLTGFLQWSTKHNSLTRPGVHCGWCTLVATFHGRNANAVLCAWKQVWDTKRDREAGTNLTHNVAGTKKIVIIIIITDSASRSCPRAKCTSITLSFFSWQPQLARHRWWGLGKFTCSIVVISEEISFFFLNQLHNWSVSNRLSASTERISSYRNRDEEMRNEK